MAFKCVTLVLIGLAVVLFQLNEIIECSRFNGIKSKNMATTSDPDETAQMDMVDVQEIDCSNSDDERCMIRLNEEADSLENMRYAKLLAAYLELLDSGLLPKLKKARDVNLPLKSVQKKLEKQKTLKDFFALRF